MVAAGSNDGWYPGVCKMCMQGDCVTRVRVVDGVVVKVEGDPRALNNRGALCPRGNSAIMNLYNPWRVKAPMKRTNPQKGLDQDPGFVEISWDEALQTVADSFKRVLQDDPRKLVVISGFGQAGAMISGLGPFMSAFKSPNDIASRGSACAYHFGTFYTQGQHPDSVVDMERCDYVINVGRSQGPNVAIASSGTRAYLDAIERGVKIVTVDPRCSPEAAKSAQWVPIRPGTDQSFLLGMLYVVLYELGTIDVWFVKNRTNAPYLIAPNGYYVRDPVSLKPLLWDELQGRARSFDDIPPMQSALEGTYEVDGVDCQPAFQLIKEAIKPYTPEWAESVSTVPAATIRAIAREFVQRARIGSTIEIDGFTFPFRPVAIQYERGAYQHTIEGPLGDLVGKILLELVGALEVPGGVTGNQTPRADLLEPDADGVVKVRGEAAGVPWVWPPRAIDARIFYPVSHTRVSQAAKAILDPKAYHLDYEPEILFTCGGNPIRSGFDRELFEAAYAKVPFSVALSLTYDEAAVMADIVLPEDSFLERDMHEPGPLFVMQPHKIMEDATRSLRIFPWRDCSAVRRLYNTRNVLDILMELAERIGILYGENGYIDKLARLQKVKLDLNHRYTGRELAEEVLKQVWGQQYAIEGITDESGPVYMNLTAGRQNFNYYYWPDNKTRHPMYMLQLLKIGDDLRDNLAAQGLAGVPGWENDMDHFWTAFRPIPTWVPCAELSAPADYDLWAMNWKTPGFPFACGDTVGNVWLHEVMSTFDPYEYSILMNAQTAQKKGLKDGDAIIVESRHGKTGGRLKTTQLIHPDAIGVPSIHGARSSLANPIVGEGPYFNALCSVDERDRVVDPITGGIESGPAVKVYRVRR